MQDDRDREAVAAAAGGVIVAVAGFLPWVSPGEIGVNSLLALVAGIAAVAWVLARDWERGDRLGVGALGVVVTLYAVYRIVEPPGPGDAPGAVPAPDVGPGVGVYVALLGGLVIVAAAGLALSAEG